MTANLNPKTPSGRVRRSAVQCFIGLIPGTVTLLNEAHLSLVKAGKYSGISVGGVLVICLVQNYAEGKGWLRTGQP